VATPEPTGVDPQDRLPDVGLARQYLGTYAWGFGFFALFALCTLVLLRSLQADWTSRWVGAGGRARTAGHVAVPAPEAHPGVAPGLAEAA